MKKNSVALLKLSLKNLDRELAEKNLFLEVAVVSQNRDLEVDLRSMIYELDNKKILIKQTIHELSTKKKKR